MDPGKKLVLGANPLKPLHGLYMNFTKLDKPTPVNGSPSTVKAASKSEKRNMLKTASRAVVTVPVSEIPPEQWPTLFKGIQVPVLILYGTNQGTSKQYALQLANELEKNNFVPEVAACDEYRFEDIPRNPILIVVTATYNGYVR
jgi:sulfite reductase alpha subunit-like flavoprotein